MQVRPHAICAVALAALCISPALSDQLTGAAAAVNKTEEASVRSVCQSAKMNDAEYAARCHSMSDHLLACVYVADETAALRDIEKKGLKTWPEIKRELTGKSASAWRALGLAESAPASESTYQLGLSTYRQCAAHVNVPQISVRPRATPFDRKAFLDQCVNKMGASPEYAWAFAHPEERMPGDPVAQAETGVLYDFAWPGSPGGAGPVVAFHASVGPETPIGQSPNQEAENIFQTEAVILAGAYHEVYDRLVSKGSTEADAKGGAVAEVTKDARIWCGNATNRALYPQ